MTTEELAMEICKIVGNYTHSEQIYDLLQADRQRIGKEISQQLLNYAIAVGTYANALDATLKKLSVAVQADEAFLTPPPLDFQTAMGTADTPEQHAAKFAFPPGTGLISVFYAKGENEHER